MREQHKAKEQKRFAAQREARRRQYGEDAVAESESEEEGPLYECVACEKVFKSEKQMQNHEK